MDARRQVVDEETGNEPGQGLSLKHEAVPLSRSSAWIVRLHLLPVFCVSYRLPGAEGKAAQALPN